MKQRYSHTVINNCSLRDIYEKEKDGWEVCAATSAEKYPNPTVYFKRPVEN